MSRLRHQCRQSCAAAALGLLAVAGAGCTAPEAELAPAPTPASDAPIASITPAAGSEPQEEPRPTQPIDAPTTEAATAASPTVPEEQAVLVAYQGYWDAILAANDPPDEFDPALERYATGEAFESVFEAAQTNRLAGRALRLPEESVSEHRAEVVSIEGDTATVGDCAIDDGLVVDVETGEVVNDEVVTRLVTGTLRLVDGQWKVTTTRVEQSWEGVAGCALDA